MKGTTQGSDIVQVEGGHIIRSTGRKDRHSKVYTSKGPRDRRVRLSAHTAIQFYDVQDRLGYDRPSKAVDWLIKKAKTAIDKLDDLAPPKDCSNPNSNDLPLSEPHYTPHPDFSFAGGDQQPDSHFVNTVRSFFPASAANFPGFSGDESASRGEDLGLSLHSFQQGFQRINGWSTNGNSTGEMDGGGRVGTFVMSPPPAAGRAAFSDHGMSFSHRELLQSNLSVNPWNHHHSHRPLANYDHNSHPKSTNSSDFEIPFELGFRVPARIYGEEDPNSHR